MTHILTKRYYSLETPVGALYNGPCRDALHSHAGKTLIVLFWCSALRLKTILPSVFPWLSWDSGGWVVLGESDISWKKRERCSQSRKVQGCPAGASLSKTQTPQRKQSLQLQQHSSTFVFWGYYDNGPLKTLFSRGEMGGLGGNQEFFQQGIKKKPNENREAQDCQAQGSQQ